MNTPPCKKYGNRRKLACPPLTTDDSTLDDSSYRLDDQSTSTTEDEEFPTMEEEAGLIEGEEDDNWQPTNQLDTGLKGEDDIASGLKPDPDDDETFTLDEEEKPIGGHSNTGEKVVTLINSNPMVGETKISSQRLKEVVGAGAGFDTSDPDPKNLDDEEFKDTMRQPVTPRKRRSIGRREEGMGMALKRGEVEGWEECPKVVSKERKDYYEFVVSLPSLSRNCRADDEMI